MSLFRAIASKLTKLQESVDIQWYLLFILWLLILKLYHISLQRSVNSPVLDFICCSIIVFVCELSSTEIIQNCFLENSVFLSWCNPLVKSPARSVTQFIKAAKSSKSLKAVLKKINEAALLLKALSNWFFHLLFFSAYSVKVFDWLFKQAQHNTLEHKNQLTGQY